MLTVRQLRALLTQHRLRLTKRLGQHHLIDARAVDRIVEAADVSSTDTVVEIGAGLGALTEPLAERAGRVIALEVDRKICALLTERMRGHGNVTVREEDVLRFSWAALSGVTVVGAIPYHITSPIIASLCVARRAIRQAVLIVQDEVAGRLLAKPSTKAYGRLSVLAQYCWDVEPVMALPRGAFFPQPDVRSRCVRFRAMAHPPVRVGNEPLFFDVVKRAFAHRRKTLVSCLRDSTPALARREAETLVGALGWPASIRGEALSIEQFAALTHLLDRSYRPR